MSQVGRAVEKLTSQGANDERAWIQYRLFLSATGMLMFLGAAGWAVWQLWIALRTGVWRDFWLSAPVPLGTASVALTAGRTLISYDRDARVAAGIRALRDAAAGGDEDLAPRVSHRPKPVSTVELSVPRITYGPFDYPDVDLTTILAMGAGMLSVVGALLTAIGVVLALTLSTNGDSGAPVRHYSPVLAWALTAGLLSLGMAIVGVGLNLARRVWQRRRGLGVVADERGVAPDPIRWSPDSSCSAWHEARSFFRIWVADSSVKRAHWLYVVDCGERAVAWALEDSALKGGHNQLEWLIVARTRLPLRDLSDQVARLTQTKRAVTVDSNTTDAFGSIVASQKVRAYNEALALPIWTRRAIALLVGPVLFIGLLYGSGWGLQRIQAWQYGSLVGLIHAEKPLFHDALNVDDHRWLLEPANDAVAGFDFVRGSYSISRSPDQTDYAGVQAQPDQTFGDVAVEVVVRQLGANSQYDSVGLILRDSTSPDAEVIFEVSSVGEWSIGRQLGSDMAERPDPYAVYFEHNDAIRTGKDATNRLLVLMRGHQYLCFVNNQFVGAYYDDLLTVGKMGLFMSGDGRTAGLFSDFTVYPAV